MSEPQPYDEVAVFNAYVGGSSYRQLREQYGIPQITAIRLVERLGGRDRNWSRISKENRENAQQEKIAQIVKLAGEIFGMRPGALWHSTRKDSVVRVRQAAFLVARDTGMSLAGIGRAFEMNHATVIHGCRQAENIASRSPEYAESVAVLRGAVERRLA